eukprot:358708-Chlamydomonas_euryale.AAC.3
MPHLDPSGLIAPKGTKYSLQEVFLGFGPSLTEPQPSDPLLCTREMRKQEHGQGIGERHVNMPRASTVPAMLRARSNGTGTGTSTEPP